MHPKKLGRYELVRVLGKGAMGVVYEARDPNLDRRVAIKTIMVDALGSAAGKEYEERFRVEARSAARLLHPNIVTVYDSDRDGDTAFLVMEFVEGDDLKQHLDRGELYPPGQALHLITDMLAALDFAHRQGVVHRDVKPANLLREPGGRLKLTDFGVARIAGEATRTQGSMIGTLKYMAPEQVQGLKVDSRADLFSAGVLAYQLLTGARPFDGDNDFSIIHQVLGHEPPPPSAVVPGLPRTVDTVMARALAKDREQRFQTADDFSKALQQAFEGVDLGALGAPPPQPVNVAAQPSMPLRRAETIPGAPITQELELEYWRDVRDATDARELEGFLARFPEGIYADLARRRLERLQGADNDPERTMLRGMTLPPNQVPAVPVPVRRSGTLPGTSVPAIAPAIQQEAEVPAPALTQAEPSLVEAQPEPAAAPAPSPASARSPAAAAPKKSRAPLWAGVAAVAVIAIGAAAWSARPRAPIEAVPAAAPAVPPVETASAAVVPASAAVPSAALPASAAMSAASVAAMPASAASAARAPASRAAAAKAPSPARRASAASAATIVQPTPQPASTPAVPERKADEAQSANRQSAQRVVPPGETCKDRIFLAKELCLQSECAKPGFASYPACIKLREDARLREESNKIRN
ncbi:serine/threonine-protein kinase [Ramlibacter humi]|uniref:non-specific serine/threonine protein kinase n=1 Tax=Ramlibacter humi TaxID=2530451 RepID=A0A4Z0CB54_9BURK|nr:serine/threonine-protein kinase [Ramlibacter humi]TFZ08561.1 serine/threonine protein kinase [Ramlibacter humi]